MSYDGAIHSDFPPDTRVTHPSVPGRVGRVDEVWESYDIHGSRELIATVIFTRSLWVDLPVSELTKEKS